MGWWRWNWVGGVSSERVMNDVVNHHTLFPSYLIRLNRPHTEFAYNNHNTYLSTEHILLFECVQCLRALLYPLFNPPSRQHERPLMPTVLLVPIVPIVLIVPTQPIPLVTSSAKLWNQCTTSQMHRPKPRATGLPHRSPRRVVKNTKRFSTRSNVLRMCHC